MKKSVTCAHLQVITPRQHD